MAKCATCNSTIIFGAKQHNGNSYCNDKCLQSGLLHTVIEQIPADVLDAQIKAVHEGPCPVCQGRGPVDVHTSHTIWSLLIMTQWKSTPKISCRSCGIKSQLGSAFTASIVGWWGFPWGILGTPVQIVRNIIGIAKGPDPQKPSDELRRIVSLNIASHLVQESRNREN